MEKLKSSKAIALILITFSIALAGLVIAETITSGTSTEFDVFFENDTCLIIDDVSEANFPGLDLGSSYWKFADNDPVDSRNGCFREGGVNLNGDTKTTCCPHGYTCNPDEECVFEPRDRCSDFGDSEEECTGTDDGHADLASNELESIIKTEFPGGCEGYNEVYGDLCYEYLDCKCEWDDSDNTCTPGSNHKVGKISEDRIQNWNFSSLPTTILSDCSAPGPSQSGQCTFEFTYQGNCLDGDEFITRSWTADYATTGATATDPLDYCQPGSEIIPCERVVRLPFFGIQNIILTIMVLIIIYYFIIRKKK